MMSNTMLKAVVKQEKHTQHNQDPSHNFAPALAFGRKLFRQVEPFEDAQIFLGHLPRVYQTVG